MDDAFLVGRQQRFGNSDGDVELAFERDAVLEFLVEVAAVDPLEHEVVIALVMDEVVDSADIRVGELREGAGLAREAGTGGGVGEVGV